MSKLLSIAIPTWNRAKTLDNSLSFLIPQVLEFKDDIELIISDNSSNDNTKEIICKWSNKYAEIDFVIFYQCENTGFYGNFKKCKELATGKFIWILSDDDFIEKNVLSNIVTLLTQNELTLAILYLNNTDRIGKEDSLFSFNTDQDILDLFYKYNYRLTLVSSVIFINIKENDQVIYKKFNNSNLIGFALLIDTILYRRKSAVISGKTLRCRMDTISGYNIYDAFVYNIFEIFDYMLQIGYKKNIISTFKESLVKHIWVKRYFYYKAKGKLDAGLDSYDIKKVNNLFRSYFGGTINYWLLIYPLTITPSFIIKILYPFVERIRNKTRTILKSKL